MPSPALRVACECQQTVLELSGNPIYATICHCDDCQAAAQQLADHYGVKTVLDAYLGTPYVLHRKDRYAVLSGQSHLTGHQLRSGSPTFRMVAACCGAPMFLAFRNAQHWITVYRQRIQGHAPAPASRMMTKYLPPGHPLAHDIPSCATFPVQLVTRLVYSRLCMAVGR